MSVGSKQHQQHQHRAVTLSCSFPLHILAHLRPPFFAPSFGLGESLALAWQEEMDAQRWHDAVASAIAKLQGRTTGVLPRTDSEASSAMGSAPGTLIAEGRVDVAGRSEAGGSAADSVTAEGAATVDVRRRRGWQVGRWGAALECAVLSMVPCSNISALISLRMPFPSAGEHATHPVCLV